MWFCKHLRALPAGPTPIGWVWASIRELACRGGVSESSGDLEYNPLHKVALQSAASCYKEMRLHAMYRPRMAPDRIFVQFEAEMDGKAGESAPRASKAETCRIVPQMDCIRMKGTKHLIKYWEVGTTKFDDEMWVELETALRHKVPPDARARIQIITQLFALVGPASKHSVTWASIAREVEGWRRHTIKLRQKIGAPFSGSPRRIRRASLLKRYSKFELPDDMVQHLAYLQKALELAVDTSDYIVRQITSRKNIGTRDQAMWFVWVAFIERVLRGCGIRTTAGSGDKQYRDSPFIVFLEKLQESLPPKCRKRQSLGSIAKGIQSARAKFGRTGLRALVLVLGGCGTGLREIPLGPLGPTVRFTMRANRMLSAL
jgi:hypothetical protein